MRQLADDGSLVVEVIHGFSYDPSHFWIDYSSDLYVREPGASTSGSLACAEHQSPEQSTVWSPDGRRMRSCKQPSCSITTTFMSSILTAGACARDESQGWYSPPRWSPDGLKLTFFGLGEDAQQ